MDSPAGPPLAGKPVDRVGDLTESLAVVALADEFPLEIFTNGIHRAAREQGLSEE